MNQANQPPSLRTATLINIFGKYTYIFIQIIYGAILARILTPEDFGVVAVVTVFTSFFLLIADMGIGPAVIQNKNLDENDMNNIFAFTIYIGLIISVLFVLFSILLSVFFNDHVFIPIGALLGISLFFNTANTVPDALLIKAYRFKFVNFRLVIISIIVSIPTIYLAFFGLKYYVIVINSILVALITFIWNLVVVKPKFNLSIKRSSLEKIREFSTYQYAFGIINYFSRNLDNLLIGRFIGRSALGYYDKSYKLMLYPVHNLTHVITPVLHPIFSAHQDDKSYIFEQYLKVIKILSLLGVFISSFSFFAAEEIIILLYGNQWYASVLSFKFLALSIWAQMVTSSTGSIFQSIGNTKLLLKAGIMSALLIVSSIAIGVSLGSINTVAAFVSISYCVNVLISFYLLINKGLEKSTYLFFRRLLPDLMVFAVTFLSLYLISLIKVNNLFTSAFLKFFIGGIVYFLMLNLTNQIKYFRRIIK